MDQNTCLIKYFRERQHAESLVEGNLFCNTVASFLNFERDKERADFWEGTFSNDPVQETGSRLFVDGVDVTDGLIHFQARTNKVNGLYLYCMSAVPQHEERSIFIHPAANLGNYAVVFHDGVAFVERLRYALAYRDLMRLHRQGPVEYYQTSTFLRILDPLETLFYKHARYEKQSEYRFVFDADRLLHFVYQQQPRVVGQNEPILLNIGKLRDIAEIMHISV